MATTGKLRRDLLPSSRHRFERELGKLTRPNSKGWALGRCPVHQSKSGRSFAVNLDTGAWCCFAGCGKGPDLLSFIRWRYNLSFADACRELGCWDETGSTSTSEIRRQRQARAQQQADAEAEIDRQRQERLGIRTWLHCLERCYRAASDRLCQLSRGSAEAYSGETQVMWDIMDAALPQIRQAEREYFQLAGVSAA